MKKYQSTASGEFPKGIYWSPGEIREIPADWPGADTKPPSWLKPLKPSKKKKKETQKE